MKKKEIMNLMELFGDCLLELYTELSSSVRFNLMYAKYDELKQVVSDLEEYNEKRNEKVCSTCKFRPKGESYQCHACRDNDEWKVKIKILEED